ncbi:inactive polyglycylase TTLL10, partial [Tamandua tetradactyla]|uniref:inactive polyglycylase TTLL10 n=1 Tax=Tamandua tetradactyla TaxID=48850 RepID=UPI004053992E
MVSGRGAARTGESATRLAPKRTRPTCSQDRPRAVAASTCRDLSPPRRELALARLSLHEVSTSPGPVPLSTQGRFWKRPDRTPPASLPQAHRCPPASLPDQGRSGVQCLCARAKDGVEGVPQPGGQQGARPGPPACRDSVVPRGCQAPWPTQTQEPPAHTALSPGAGETLPRRRVGQAIARAQGPGTQAAWRARRGRGATRPPRSHVWGLCRWGPPGRVCSMARRSQRSRATGIRRSRPHGPGWAQECSMGSGQNEGLLCHLGQLDQDAAIMGDADVVGPQAAVREEALLSGQRQPPSTGASPCFYIGGTNGAAIISSYCRSKGWQRTLDSQRDDYKLKWCETKSRNSYCTFREGEQLLFQLPNNKLLTTKIGLLSALRGHARAAGKACRPLSTQARVLQMEDFFPETYRLDIKDEREAFFALFNETQMWICKPTASNQGKGIFLLRTREDIAALQAKAPGLEDHPSYLRAPFRGPQARVVQRYIQNPLLLEGKKFDVRSYLLIACAAPFMVFFGHGYARLTLGLYDPHSDDLSGHLTNQFMQKKSPLYVLLKEDTVWSMEHLNRYINDKFQSVKGLPRDWVFTTFTNRMQRIMAHCFLAVRSKLECKLGYFDLIGCDFLIDENFKVWLLEMSSNPALHTNCTVLKEVVPGVVAETLDLALETFQKSLRSQKMLPLLSQSRFVLLHNGEADLWPRLGGQRSAGRPLPGPRASGETAAPRPGTRRSAPP